MGVADGRKCERCPRLSSAAVRDAARFIPGPSADARRRYQDTRCVLVRVLGYRVHVLVEKITILSLRPVLVPEAI